MTDVYNLDTCNDLQSLSTYLDKVTPQIRARGGRRFGELKEVRYSMNDIMAKLKGLAAEDPQSPMLAKIYERVVTLNSQANEALEQKPLQKALTSFIRIFSHLSRENKALLKEKGALIKDIPYDETQLRVNIIEGALLLTRAVGDSREAKADTHKVVATFPAAQRPAALKEITTLVQNTSAKFLKELARLSPQQISRVVHQFTRLRESIGDPFYKNWIVQDILQHCSLDTMAEAIEDLFPLSKGRKDFWSEEILFIGNHIPRMSRSAILKQLKEAGLFDTIISSRDIAFLLGAMHELGKRRGPVLELTLKHNLLDGIQKGQYAVLQAVAGISDEKALEVACSYNLFRGIKDGEESAYLLRALADMPVDVLKLAKEYGLLDSITDTDGRVAILVSLAEFDESKRKLVLNVCRDNHLLEGITSGREIAVLLHTAGSAT